MTQKTKNRPILFSGPMVRAHLREIDNPGTGKTQTRRVLQKPTWAQSSGWPERVMDQQELDGRLVWFHKETGCASDLPIPQINDRLWVREAFRLTDDGEYECAVFEADEKDVADHVAGIRRIQKECNLPESWAQSHLRKRPSIYMPRWASRITDAVTDVRIERLQDITETDAIAEGVERMHGGYHDDDNVYQNYLGGSDFGGHLGATNSFRTLWDSLNGKPRKPGGPDISWAANPWVVVTTFTPHLCNIDQMPEAAQ